MDVSFVLILWIDNVSDIKLIRFTSPMPVPLIARGQALVNTGKINSFSREKYQKWKFILQAEVGGDAFFMKIGIAFGNYDFLISNYGWKSIN